MLLAGVVQASHSAVGITSVTKERRMTKAREFDLPPDEAELMVASMMKWVHYAMQDVWEGHTDCKNEAKSESHNL